MASFGWNDHQAQAVLARERVTSMSLLIVIALLAILLGGIAAVLLAIHGIDVPKF
jgi:hypothetical protein